MVHDALSNPEHCFVVSIRHKVGYINGSAEHLGAQAGSFSSLAERLPLHSKRGKFKEYARFDSDNGSPFYSAKGFQFNLICQPFAKQ